MKAYIIQPRYSMDSSEMEACFLEELRLLNSCDENADIIVLPEYSDVLSATLSDEEFIKAMRIWSYHRKKCKGNSEALPCYRVCELWF